MSDEPDELEIQLRKSFDAKDYDATATLFIEHHGAEILGFLVGRLRNTSDAAEVFSIFAEDFWCGLPGFQWRTSMRSWAFTLARNAAHQYSRDPQRRAIRNLTFTSKNSRFAQVVTQFRAATKMHLRTEIKSKMRSLYQKLPPDDQSLLFFRIDKQMSWQEIAVIMSGEGEEMDEAEQKQWANRLRQRFHAVKQHLKDLAKSEGLL
jgi:RNA polymerase sigma-70 factor (ECF subfamily)